jgi:fibrillarin-like pre-rRNA processing protein
MLPDGVVRHPIDGEKRLCTEGESVYGEPHDDGYRVWDRSRSKVAAVLAQGIDTGLAANDTILYLGAASGTTVSHVADFAGPTYAVEFAPGPMRELVALAQTRPNIIPLLKNVKRPKTYAHVVESNVDCIIQDVATTKQAKAACDNAQFLSPDGNLILSLKARSEDVTADPHSVYDAARNQLREVYQIQHEASLEPDHQDHHVFIATLQS